MKITLAGFCQPGQGMFIRSELNLQVLMHAYCMHISPLNKTKDSSIDTVPVCSVAQGERASQKPQIEDSL